MALKRYIVVCNGIMIGHAETEEKAWHIAHKDEYEVSKTCWKNGQSYIPNEYRVEEEILV